MDKLEELEKLAKLKEQWILTEDEFVSEKRRVLDGRTNEAPQKANAVHGDRFNPEFSKLPTYHDSATDGPFAMFLSHRGRITRSQWIIRMIVLSIALMPYFVIHELGGKWWSAANLDQSERMLWLLFVVLFLLALYGLFAVTSKRFHDFNTHGINQMIPVYGFFAPLLKRGNGVDNFYGPPKTYSGVAENARPGLSPWFGWTIVAWIAAIFAVIAILGLSETETESKNESGPTVSTEMADSSWSSLEGRRTIPKSSVNEWVKYESSEHGFVAEFPSRPKFESETSEWVEVFMAVAKHETALFSVRAYTFADEVGADSWALDEQLVRRFLEEVFWKLDTFSVWRPITLMEQREQIGFVATLVEDKSKVEGRMTFIDWWRVYVGFVATLVEDKSKVEGRMTFIDWWRVYATIARYEEGRGGRPESVDRFLDSFEATK